MRPGYDVIFCRNVFIYFDAATKARIVDRFADLLRPGGYLYLGHTEFLTAQHPRLESVGRTIYRRKA
jgi:chemotaxis protein methyltransferase CheR